MREARAADKPMPATRPHDEGEEEDEEEIPPKRLSFEHAVQKATVDDQDKRHVRSQSLACELGTSCYGTGIFVGAGCARRRDRFVFAYTPNAT
jgi:hypothetical protein